LFPLVPRSCATIIQTPFLVRVSGGTLPDCAT
jgi:hypothetical protein